MTREITVEITFVDEDIDIVLSLLASVHDKMLEEPVSFDEHDSRTMGGLFANALRYYIGATPGPAPQLLLASLRRLEAEVTGIKEMVGHLVEKQSVPLSVTIDSPDNVPADVIDNLMNIGE